MTWVADTPFTAPRWSEPGAVESAAARPFTPTRPPRHVHLIPSLSLGGAERIVADLACCYAECGTAADLVILRNSAVEHPLRAGTGAGEGTGAGVAVHRLGALPWPEREGHRPGRKAGALVVLVDGGLVFYVERGGRTLLSFTEDTSRLGPAAVALASSVRQGLLGKLTVERADGGHVFGSARVSEALQEAGFRMTPQGLRLRPSG